MGCVDGHRCGVNQASGTDVDHEIERTCVVDSLCDVESTVEETLMTMVCNAV